MDNGWLENLDFNHGSPVAYFVMLPWVMLVSVLLYKYVKNQNSRLYKHKTRLMKFLPFAVGVYAVITGVIWVVSANSYPIFDAAEVMNAANDFSRDNFERLDERYLNMVPYQLGFVFFMEVFIRLLRIFGLSYEDGGMRALQILNVICLAVSYFALIKITAITFKNNMMTVFTAILLMFCLQPILFTNYMYGNTPGFMFSVLSVWFALIFFETGKAYHAFDSAICIGLAAMVKQNSLIILVALCIMILLNFLHKKLYKSPKQIAFSAGFLALAITLGVILNPLAISHYERRSGISISEGLPVTAWLVMGVNDSFVAPGWWFNTPMDLYDELDRNKEATRQAHIQMFEQRMEEFKEEGAGYAVWFFFRKFSSQWNETTYQSIWLNQRFQHNSKTFPASYVCGDGEQQMKDYMDVYSALIFTMFTAGLILLLRRKNRDNLAVVFLPLIILGGFLYHSVFEAKPQYAIFYYVMMIPIAGYTLVEFTRYIIGRINAFKGVETT